MIKYMVVYASETGNTKKLAKEIFALLKDTSKDISDIKDLRNTEDAETYLIGFWTNRGNCQLDIMNFLAELHGKKIVLFGTCGMGGSEAYFRSIENSVSAMIPDDNEYLGMFMCQGKMPIQIRQKYESMLDTADNPAQVKYMIKNFDEALLHPNQRDYEDAKKFLERLGL